MGKVKHKIAVYGKMYGCTLPTVKKMEDAGVVTEIITVAYNAGYSDAETKNNRLAELEKIVVDGPQIYAIILQAAHTDLLTVQSFRPLSAIL